MNYPRLSAAQFAAIHPLNADVWIQVATQAEILGTDLFTLQHAQDQNNVNRQGKVIAIGPDQSDVAVGDYVWYQLGNGLGATVVVDGRQCHVLRPSEDHAGVVMLYKRINKGIEAIGDFVAVEVNEVTKSAGGILLPADQHIDETTGRVVSVGGKVAQMRFPDTVMFIARSGYDVVVGTKNIVVGAQQRKLKMLRESEILAVLVQEPEPDTSSLASASVPVSESESDPELEAVLVKGKLRYFDKDEL